MTDSPTTTNGTASTVDQIIHALIFDVAIQAAEAYLISQAPFLATPVIKQVDEEVLKLVGNAIYKSLSMIATFTIIDLQTGAEKSAYSKAEAALRAAHLTGDANGITQATAAMRAALAALIHYDGSASP